MPSRVARALIDVGLESIRDLDDVAGGALTSRAGNTVTGTADDGQTRELLRQLDVATGVIPSKNTHTHR